MTNHHEQSQISFGKQWTIVNFIKQHKHNIIHYTLSHEIEKEPWECVSAGFLSNEKGSKGQSSFLFPPWLSITMK
jgi:hypothetical protein